ncbi:MAG TPA: ASCH domain-containing protein [Beutenbergiaceae bacterium]|nr:ASCH domain-containing protein [Beutenbergiaceae bacterium]
MSERSTPGSGAGLPGDGTPVAVFWRRARAQDPGLPEQPDDAWAFGVTPAHAEELLALVLEGVKTATSSSGWDYPEPATAPQIGDVSVILDGEGMPGAVIETTDVKTCPFNEVTEAHAYAEGEGTRSLGEWREIHERFWQQHSARGFAPEMPVLCERFVLRFPRTRD